MKTWHDDSPTEKQIELFNSLKSEYGYKKKPKTKGEYREAISELLMKQAESKTYEQPRSRSGWLWAYDDDYLGDQGIY